MTSGKRIELRYIRERPSQSEHGQVVRHEGSNSFAARSTSSELNFSIAF